MAETDSQDKGVLDAGAPVIEPERVEVADVRAADLEVLRRRAESLAQEELEIQVSDQVALLLFRIGEEWYAVDVADVREIFQEYVLTPVPCVPAYILGVINVRGEILSVTDPAKLMGIGAIDVEGDVLPPAIVIIHDDIASAVVVDEIGDIAEVPAGSIEPPVSIIDRAQGEFIAGSVYVDTTMVGVLHVERTLQPIVSGSKH